LSIGLTASLECTTGLGGGTQLLRVEGERRSKKRSSGPSTSEFRMINSLGYLSGTLKLAPGRGGVVASLSVADGSHDHGLYGADPLRNLLVAILDRAIRDLCGPEIHHARTAAWWFLGCGEGHFSFSNCCEYLELNEDSLKAKIKALSPCGFSPSQRKNPDEPESTGANVIQPQNEGE